MRVYFGFLALATGLFLSSCGRDGTPAAGRHAVVTMRDGRTLSGLVMSSSSDEIQLSTSDGMNNLAMSEVRSVEYTDANPVAPAGDLSAAPPDSRVHADHYHPPEAAVTTHTFELEAGTEIPVRTEETIDAGRAAEGQTFAAEVTKDIHDRAREVVIPRGSNAQIIIRSAAKGGHFRGASDLVLDLASVSIDGRLYRLSTRDLVEKGHDGVGANSRTAKFAGGGAAVGAIIGAIAGHGKGAAIGAGSGAGAGALTEALTKGTIKVPVESVLTFRLDAPLRMVQ
jgi:hypothetical protein